MGSNGSMRDSYYDRAEVSNSDLSALAKYMMPPNIIYDLEQAFRFGNLIDKMITEGDRCNYFTKEIDGEKYTDEEWSTSKAMRDSFRRDPLCMSIHQFSNGQQIFINEDFRIEYSGIWFSLPFRIKMDLCARQLALVADVKSTTAKSQREFEAVVEYFNYDRQAAVYLDVPKPEEITLNKFLLIGISKAKPHKIFKVAMRRGDALYNSGKQKYQELAFRHWSLFSNFFNDTKDAAPFMGSMLGENREAVLSNGFGAASLVQV